MREDIFSTDKRYEIIYADPPWAYAWGKGKNGGHFAPEKHYGTMPTDEICALDIKRLADKNCALFMWATMPCLPDAIKVMKAWGFKYKTCAFTWIKTKKDGSPLAGMGSYTKSNAELCLLGIVSFDVKKFANRDDDDKDALSIVPFQIAYAVSIHKAQGLEYDSVKIVITDEIEELISHNVFYTAITRAKNNLKIYWTEKAQRYILEEMHQMYNKQDASIIAKKYKLKMYS